MAGVILVGMAGVVLVVGDFLQNNFILARLWCP